MWVWVALCWVGAAAGAGATVCCNLTIEGNDYREEILVEDMNGTSGMAVDYATNLLYFRYLSDGVWFAAKLNLRTKAVTMIEELTGACGFSVDQVLRQVYAGCQGGEAGRGAGLYQFDSNINQFMLAGNAGQQLWYTYYNDVLYYFPKTSSLLYTFRDGVSARVQDVTSTVRGLVIDKHKDWVFYNRTGVYRQRAGSGAVGATAYAGLNNIEALPVDASGAAYACDYSRTTGGVYRLHERTPSATRLPHVGRCFSLVFDRDDNIIYTDTDNKRLIRLKKC